MGRSRVLPAALILCAGALAGCSHASSTKDAGGSDASSASGSASPSCATSPSAPETTRSRTPTPAPTGPSRRPGGGSGATPSKQPSGPADDQPKRTPHLPRDRVEAAALHKSVLVRSSAGTSQEQAVVGAWMDYWQAASDAFYFVRPTNQLRALARDQALSSVLGYIETLKKDEHRVVGWAKDNVTSVEIDGDEARVRDCTENFTFSVDVDGDPVTRPQPFYDVTGTLVRDGDRWFVTRTHSRNLTSTCLP
jgi:hypothetical protein